jgi:hypothetical protein
MYLFFLLFRYQGVNRKNPNKNTTIFVKEEEEEGGYAFVI